MRPASVGFQCPECVKEGNATVRPARTVVGARLTGSGTPVTVALIAACVLVYVVQIGYPAVDDRLALFGLGVTLSDQGPALTGVAAGQPYRLVTTLFAHASPLHLLFNMVSLWFVGRPLETLLGRWRYLALYTAGGLAGSATAYVLDAPSLRVVGASGAIFAVFGALIVLARRVGADLRGMIGLLVLNLALTVFRPGISWQAHVGGLVAGVLLGVALGYAPARRRTLVQAAGFAVVAVVIVAAVVLRTADLGGTLV